MDNPFTEGNVAYLWYQAWLPVIGSVGALALLVYMYQYSVGGLKGTIGWVFGGLSFLGMLPLTLERIGIGFPADMKAGLQALAEKRDPAKPGSIAATVRHCCSVVLAWERACNRFQTMITVQIP